MKKHIEIGSVLLLSVVALTGCDSNDKKFLIGKWETKQGNIATFNKDNTAVHTYKNYKQKYKYEILNPKSDNHITVKETNKRGQYKIKFKITSPHTIQIEKIKEYDKDGGLVSESNGKGKKVIFEKVK